jgi:hypothetical protein
MNQHRPRRDRACEYPLNRRARACAWRPSRTGADRSAPKTGWSEREPGHVRSARWPAGRTRVRDGSAGGMRNEARWTAPGSAAIRRGDRCAALGATHRASHLAVASDRSLGGIGLRLFTLGSPAHRWRESVRRALGRPQVSARSRLVSRCLEWPGAVSGVLVPAATFNQPSRLLGLRGGALRATCCEAAPRDRRSAWRVAINRHVEQIHVTRLEFVCQAAHGPHSPHLSESQRCAPRQHRASQHR